MPQVLIVVVLVLAEIQFSLLDRKSCQGSVNSMKNKRVMVIFRLLWGGDPCWIWYHPDGLGGQAMCRCGVAELR